MTTSIQFKSLKAMPVTVKDWIINIQEAEVFNGDEGFETYLELYIWFRLTEMKEEEEVASVIEKLPRFPS